MKLGVGLDDILHVTDILKILAKESLYGVHNEFRTAVFLFAMNEKTRSYIRFAKTL